MANASVAIEVSTLGTTKTLQDLKGVELSTSKMLANLKNAKIDLGLKKQFEDANREAQRFQQQNLKIMAQMGGRALFSGVVSGVIGKSELAEPIKRALELSIDMGLQMMTMRSMMQEMSKTNIFKESIKESKPIFNSILGGATAGVAAGGVGGIVGGAINAPIQKEFLKQQKITNDIINATNVRESEKAIRGQQGRLLVAQRQQIKQIELDKQWKNQSVNVSGPFLGQPYSKPAPNLFPVMSAPTPMSNILPPPLPKPQLILPAAQQQTKSAMSKVANFGAMPISGMGTALVATGGIIAATVAIEYFMKQMGELAKDIDNANKSIAETRLGVVKMDGSWTELGKNILETDVFKALFPVIAIFDKLSGRASNLNPVLKDKAITKEQLAEGYVKIRGAQAKDLLEKSAKDLMTLSDGSKKLFSNLEEVKQAEIVIALNKKQFNANDYEAVKKLNYETEKLYNKQKSIIDFNKQMIDTLAKRSNPESAINNLQLSKAQLGLDYVNANNSVIKELQKNITLINASIEDVNTANLKSTLRQIEDKRFLRDNPEQLKKMSQRGFMLDETTYVDQFKDVFAKLLSNANLTMSNAEKSALAWEMVNKNVQNTIEEGSKSQSILLNLMKDAGKQEWEINSLRSTMTRDNVFNSPSASSMDKFFADIQFNMEGLQNQKQRAISGGRRFGTTERLDYGTQAAFNVIVDQKQKESDPVLKELKNINAQQVNELKLHTAFLAKLIEQGQKVK